MCVRACVWCLGLTVTTRAPSPVTASDQISLRWPTSVCTQCCVSSSHSLASVSFDVEMSSGRSASSRKCTSVTASLWPCSRHWPASAMTSHTTMSVSLPADASRLPARLKASAVTPFLCPWKVTVHSPSPSDQMRTEPSL